MALPLPLPLPLPQSKRIRHMSKKSIKILQKYNKIYQNPKESWNISIKSDKNPKESRESPKIPWNPWKILKNPWNIPEMSKKSIKII